MLETWPLQNRRYIQISTERVCFDSNVNIVRTVMMMMMLMMMMMMPRSPVKT